MKSDIQKILVIFCIVSFARAVWLTVQVSALESNIVQLTASHQAELDATVIAGEKRLIAANALADSLAAELRNKEESLQKISERKQHEIIQVSTNRTCFNADLIRVLNSTGSGSSTPGVPAPAIGLDSGDDAIATDTDVALWIENAKEQYEVCRARYKALIDFYPPKPSTSTTHD